MQLQEAQERFVQSWGTLGSSWGINRTMAQIHALLLITAEPISTDDIMERLNISRGNANMNLRALIDWALIHKVHKPGERMEYFGAEKDMWHVAMRIMRERRKRELEPIMDTLMQLKRVEGNDSADKKEFERVIQDIDDLADRADTVMRKMERADQNWFLTKVLKLFSN